jgi:hypothetical protein
MQSQLNWIVILMYIGIANMLYIFQIKSILKTRKQTNKKNQPNDTFNRFHSPVIVHRKHEGAVTRHEFLPSSARKHLQLQGGCCPPDPLLTGSFVLATPLTPTDHDHCHRL